jgi:NitT/TauT family transport system substrate-binding protein
MEHRNHLIRESGIIILLFCTLLTQAQLPRLVFVPHWLPQAQFAGYYVAQDRGFYRDAGIDVEIKHPSASIQVTSMLASGEADLISLFLITGLSARNKGLDLVNFGQISQHSAILIVTKKSGGIEQLSQLNGKKIGIWKSGFDEVPKALIEEKGYHVEWVPILSTVNLFMMGGIDAMTVMLYNEYNQLISSGLNEDEINKFPMADFGFDVPEDGLYCLKSTYENRKPELKRFLQATLKGWEYAAANKEYAINIVLKRMQMAHIPANKVHQTWMLNKVVGMIFPGNKMAEAGQLLESDFLKAVGILNKGDKVKSEYIFTDFYSPVLK